MMFSQNMNSNYSMSLLPYLNYWCTREDGDLISHAELVEEKGQLLVNGEVYGDNKYRLSCCGGWGMQLVSQLGGNLSPGLGENT